MPLFICENCGCVDSTRYVIPGTDNDKINMTLSEMQGEANRSINILSLEGYQTDLASNDINRPIDPLHPNIPIDIEDFEPLTYKFADMVLMLCSECNTGVWHNHFEKLKAHPDMVKLSEQSLYKYIDKEDNIELVIDYIKNKEKEDV